MKPKYILLDFSGLGYYIIKRLSGGSRAYKKTITDYEIIYPDPNELDNETKRIIKDTIKGRGTTKGMLFPADKFHDSVHGIIKEIFESGRVK